MKIIIDFDHTLFSARKFFLALQKSFRFLEEDLFKETFEGSKKDGKGYDPQEQFRLIIGEKPNLSLDDLKRAYDQVLDKASEFLYPDVLSFLEKYSRENDLYILSYGREYLQKEKIEKSRIKRFFKAIQITESENKTSALAGILGEEKTFFIDDNPKCLAEIKKNFPQVITIRIKRGEGKYSNYPSSPQIDYSIKNLAELQKII